MGGSKGLAYEDFTLADFFYLFFNLFSPGSSSRAGPSCFHSFYVFWGRRADVLGQSLVFLSIPCGQTCTLLFVRG
jgi:hypothetical protein